MLIGNDAESVATRIAELLAIISARQQAATTPDTQEARFRPDIVVVFDGSRKLRTLPGTIQLLQEGPQAGSTRSAWTATSGCCPPNARPSSSWGERVRVQQAKAESLPQIRPDLVPPDWCAELARSLAPVRDVSNSDDARCCRTRPGCSTCWGWNRRPPGDRGPLAGGGRSTLAMIGESYDGPFGIDLRKDGPHALIAGPPVRGSRSCCRRSSPRSRSPTGRTR